MKCLNFRKSLEIIIKGVGAFERIVQQTVILSHHANSKLLLSSRFKIIFDN